MCIAPVKFSSRNWGHKRACFGGPKGQEERSWAAGKRLKALKPIKCDRVFVLRLDDEGKGLHIAFKYAKRRVGQQRAAEPLTVKALIDGETADQGGGQERITRQTFENVRWQFTGLNACRRK